MQTQYNTPEVNCKLPKKIFFMANAWSCNPQTQNCEMSEYPQHDHFEYYYCMVFGVFPNFISIGNKTMKVSSKPMVLLLLPY